MQNWMSQIVIGVVVTVIGTVVAHVVVKGMGGKGLFGGSHYSGSFRAGR
jgi:xanthine/uracil permease